MKRQLCIFLYVLLALAWPVLADMVSPMYLTRVDFSSSPPGGGSILVVQGSSVINSWSTAGQYEAPIAVSQTVRTIPREYGFEGSEYTLGGVFTGTRYAFMPGMCCFSDGTTDGTHNYTVNVFGRVYQLDSEWNNAQLLFTLPRSADMWWYGITYDPASNSLWMMRTHDYSTYSEIVQYSMAGLHESSFRVVGTYGSFGLGMDYADDTLWYPERQVGGNYVLHQYSRTGQSMGLVGLSLGNTIFGAEFQLPQQQVVPEPRTFVPLALGTGAVLLVRRRFRVIRTGRGKDT